MKLFILLAVFCVGTWGDDKENLLNDVRGNIQTIETALNTAINMVGHTVAIKLNTKRGCWTKQTEKVRADSAEVKQLHALKDSLIKLSSDISAASSTADYVKQVLTGPNPPISQIVEQSSQVVHSLDQIMSDFDIESKCR